MRQIADKKTQKIKKKHQWAFSIEKSYIAMVVHRDCHCADEEIYERIKTTITKGINEFFRKKIGGYWKETRK